MEPKLSDNNELHKNRTFGSTVERENTQKNSTAILFHKSTFYLDKIRLQVDCIGLLLTPMRQHLTPPEWIWVIREFWLMCLWYSNRPFFPSSFLLFWSIICSASFLSSSSHLYVHGLQWILLRSVKNRDRSGCIWRTGLLTFVFPRRVVLLPISRSPPAINDGTSS
jgi:hypothetical protein